MLLHANSVAKNGSARVGTGWIDGNNADAKVIIKRRRRSRSLLGWPIQRAFRWVGMFRASIMLRQLIDESTFTSSGSPSDANGHGLASMREQLFE